MGRAQHLLTTLLCAACAAPALGLQGQSASSTQSIESEETPADSRRFFVGFRVRALPLGVLGYSKLERSATTSATSWTFTTTPKSPHLGVGPALEFNLSERLTLRTELLFHRLSYEKVTEIFQGTDNPNTSTDERKKTTLTERTKASLWDVPVMLRYQGVRPSGILSKLYLSGGLAIRSAANIRTGTETVFSDSSTDYNEIPAPHSKRNLLGGVVGAGFRFVDEFNIKVTPEVRYTFWSGFTFASESTRTSRGQLEVGIALTF